MTTFSAPHTAKANVGAIVHDLITLDGARTIRVTMVPGEPDFYDIEAEIPDQP
jgi:hypothetical protein